MKIVMLSIMLACAVHAAPTESDDLYNAENRLLPGWINLLAANADRITGGNRIEAEVAPADAPTRPNLPFLPQSLTNLFPISTALRERIRDTLDRIQNVLSSASQNTVQTSLTSDNTAAALQNLGIVGTQILASLPLIFENLGLPADIGVLPLAETNPATSNVEEPTFVEQNKDTNNQETQTSAPEVSGQTAAEEIVNNPTVNNDVPTSSAPTVEPEQPTAEPQNNQFNDEAFF